MAFNIKEYICKKLHPALLECLWNNESTFTYLQFNWKQALKSHKCIIQLANILYFSKKVHFFSLVHSRKIHWEFVICYALYWELRRYKTSSNKEICSAIHCLPGKIKGTEYCQESTANARLEAGQWARTRVQELCLEGAGSSKRVDLELEI